MNKQEKEECNDMAENDVFNVRDVLTFEDYCNSNDKRKIYGFDGKTKLKKPFKNNKADYIDFCIDFDFQYE